MDECLAGWEAEPIGRAPSTIGRRSRRSAPGNGRDLRPDRIPDM